MIPLLGLLTICMNFRQDLPSALLALAACAPERDMKFPPSYGIVPDSSGTYITPYPKEPCFSRFYFDDWFKSMKKTRITGRQIRAGRALLDMTQSDLAAAAGISPDTLNKIESGKRPAYDSTLDAIQTALENRGIVFTNGDRPGVFHDPDKAIIPT